MIDLLQIRKKLKKKKPNFLRQDAHKIKRLAKKWRKSKGLDSKIRRRLRGYRKSPSIGYSSPKKVRGLTKDGKKVIIVHNLKDLQKDTDIIISKKVGIKKKIEIIKKAQELGINIINIKNTNTFLKKIEESIKKRKEKSKERIKIKEKRKKEPIEKEKKEETKEEKEKYEKEEKRKVLEGK